MKRRLAKTLQGVLLAVLCSVLFAACSLPGLDALLATGGSSGVSGSDVSQDAAAPEDADAPAPVEDGSLFSPEYAVQAEAVCMVNEDTGLTVYEKNADAPLSAASLVKMMTCMLAMEKVQDLDAELVVSDKSWIYDELFGKNASTADIRKGETLSVRELLYAALLPSANEAALLLADYVAGGYMPNFMYMMNTRAAKLGCTGTVFVSPNGLSEEDVTTARDMVLITRAFMSYPELVEIAGTASYEMAAHEAHAAPYYITTTDRLLVPTSPYYSAFSGTAGCVLAGKTGSLGEWQNFASMAKRNGETYICVVLHSPDAADGIGPGLDPAQARPALYEAAALYDWAFTSLSIRPALDVTQPVTEIRVRYSAEQDTVRLMPASDLKTVLPLAADDTQLKRKYDLPEALSAPLEQGDVVGSITLLLGGQVVGTTDLLVEKDVARNNTLYMAGRVGDFFSSTFIKVLLVLVVLAAVAYVGLLAWAHKHPRPKARRQQADGSSGAPQTRKRKPGPAGGVRKKAPPGQAARTSAAQRGAAHSPTQPARAKQTYVRPGGERPPQTRPFGEGTGERNRTAAGEAAERKRP